MKTDKLGIPQFSNRDLIDMIYSGHVDKCHVVLCEESDDVDKFNAAMEEQGFDKLQKYIPIDVDEKTFDGALQSEWFMPDAYKDINVYEYVLQKAQTPCPQHVQERIWEELDAFKERDMLNLLRYMIYLVDFMRENSIVWGVGRGSSVASYVLYLIGIHKIDSIQYGLDWREFLR
jgi:DNA polymerase III alpha subunit